MSSELLPELLSGRRPGGGALLDAETIVDAHAQVLDWLPIGVMLVDGRGRVIRTNHAAEKILGARDCLCVRQARPCASFRDETSKLHRFIGDAVDAAKGIMAPFARAMTLTCNSTRRPLTLWIVPLRAARAAATTMDTTRPAAAVFISDPEREIAGSHQTLALLYDLTPAEARLARAIAAGKSIREFAKKASITVNTARWTLKRVQSKTGTRRQAELVRLLLTGPLGLSIDPAG